MYMLLHVTVHTQSMFKGPRSECRVLTYDGWPGAVMSCKGYPGAVMCDVYQPTTSAACRDLEADQAQCGGVKAVQEQWCEMLNKDLLTSNDCRS
jgi:hypothetical protein